MVRKGEAMFSDLNFYKIVKVKRKINENVMIYQQKNFYTNKKFNQDV